MVAASTPALSPRVTPPTSIEGADLILLELGRLDALKRRNAADLDRALAVQREKFGDRNSIEVEGQCVAIADRQAALESALSTFAEKNKANLVGDKRRFVKLNHGKFGWRKARDECEPVDGQSKAGRASLLDKLIVFIVEALAKFEGFSATAIACVNPQITWNRTALLKADAEGKLEAGELYRIGFKRLEGEDQFYCEPATVELESHSALPPS